MNEKSISIAGTGYVGLCTAVGFASKGHHDDKHGCSTLLCYLRCGLDREQAVLDTGATFVSVGTPSQCARGNNYGR